MRIIAFTYITVIETSVLAFYLLVHYLIFNLPLLCTSSWRFEICLPPIYNLIEFSPNDQIQPKLFVLVKCRDTYISSMKFVLNRVISMEVRFNTFPLSVSKERIPISILNNLKEFSLSRGMAQYYFCRKKNRFEPERAICKVHCTCTTFDGQ